MKKFEVFVYAVALVACVAVIVYCVSTCAMSVIGYPSSADLGVLGILQFVAFVALNIFGTALRDTLDEMQLEELQEGAAE